MRKVLLTNHFIVITESRCRRRVGRNQRRPIPGERPGVGRLALSEEGVCTNNLAAGASPTAF